MPIIRKGDVEAEKGLQEQANKQVRERTAGQETARKRKKNAIKEMRVQGDGSATKNGLWSERDKPYKGGPVSGGALAEMKQDDIREKESRESRRRASDPRHAIAGAYSDMKKFGAEHLVPEFEEKLNTVDGPHGAFFVSGQYSRMARAHFESGHNGARA